MFWLKFFKKTLAVFLSMAVLMVLFVTSTFAYNAEENYNTFQTNVVDENFNVIGKRITAITTETLESDGVKTIKIHESTTINFLLNKNVLKDYSEIV